METPKKQNISLQKGCLFIPLHFVWICLALAGLYYTYISFILSSNGVEVDAVVVDTGIYNDSEGGTTYSPIYEYTYQGETYRYDSVNSSSEFTHKLGDHETLLIDPNKPSHARANTFWELWLLPSILLPISCCTGVLITLVSVFVSKSGMMLTSRNFQVNN